MRHGQQCARVEALLNCWPARVACIVQLLCSGMLAAGQQGRALGHKSERLKQPNCIKQLAEIIDEVKQVVVGREEIEG